MEFVSNPNCFICGTQIYFGEDVSLINSTKEICFKFETLVSRYLNSQSSTNRNTLNVNSNTTSRIIGNIGEHNNSKKEESVCCLTCVSEVKNFCDAYKNWECFQLEMFHILGKISNLMLSTPNSSKIDIISKVEAKRRLHFPHVRLDKLKESDLHQEINDNTTFTKSDVVSDSWQQDDTENFMDFSNTYFSIEDSVAIEPEKSSNDEKVSEQGEIMVKVKLEADDDVDELLYDAKQYDDYCIRKIDCDVVETEPIAIIKPQLRRGRRKNPQIDRKCLFCNKVCPQTNRLAGHMRTHTGEAPFICRICHEEFTLPQNICRHIKSKHRNSTRFKCNICEKVVKDIRQHYSRAHGPNRWFCDICGKGFYSQTALETHMPAHSEKRNFSCDICQKTFKFPTNLLSHKRKEHPEKS